MHPTTTSRPGVRVRLVGFLWTAAAFASFQARAQVSPNTPTNPLAEAPPEHPMAAPCLACCNGPMGIPDVYLHSGELHLEEVDLFIRGRGLDFVWQRCYRSRLGPDDSGQGNGWDFSYNVWIEAVGPDIRLMDGNGRRDVYERQSDNTYVAKQFFRQATFNPDGSWVLMFPDSGTWTMRPLDGSPAAGKIDCITDRNENTIRALVQRFRSRRT